MVDQIEYVAFFGLEGAESARWTAPLSAFIERPQSRDMIRRQVQSLARKIAQRPDWLEKINIEPLEAAANIVGKSIRGLLIVAGSENGRAMLATHKLIVKFRTIEPPWIEDMEQAEMAEIMERMKDGANNGA